MNAVRGFEHRLAELTSVLAALSCLVACATGDASRRTATPSRSVSPCDPSDGGAGDWTPLEIGFIPSMQAFDRGCNTLGIRLALFGSENRDVTGLDLATLWSTTAHDARALQIAGGFQRVAGELTGVQIAGANSAGAVRGLQLSAGGSATEHLRGAQVGMLGNFAGYGAGLQLGIVNYAEALHGVQIGLLNFNEAGFLPVFPLFNVGSERTRRSKAEGTREREEPLRGADSRAPTEISVEPEAASGE